MKWKFCVVDKGIPCTIVTYKQHLSTQQSAWYLRLPGIMSSACPRITAMKLSVDISAAMCMPGYSCPPSRALMKLVFPVEY